MAPPAAPRSGRVKFVFFYITSYVGLTSRHLATIIRYADHVKQHFRLSRRHQAANFTGFITRLLRLWCCDNKHLKISFAWKIVLSKLCTDVTLYPNRRPIDPHASIPASPMRLRPAPIVLIICRQHNPNLPAMSSRRKIFPVSGPVGWNSLPRNIRNPELTYTDSRLNWIENAPVSHNPTFSSIFNYGQRLGLCLSYLSPSAAF